MIANYQNSVDWKHQTREEHPVCLCKIHCEPTNNLNATFKLTLTTIHKRLLNSDWLQEVINHIIWSKNSSHVQKVKPKMMELDVQFILHDLLLYY